jgi:uncharacterized protein YbjT (DUF2867 family)
VIFFRFTVMMAETPLSNTFARVPRNSSVYCGRSPGVFMIVVTAPTGAIGSKVLADLLERGEPVRVIAESIRDQGVFFSPIAADLKLPTVATRDVVTVAARLLADRGWAGHGSVPVLGAADLSFVEIARILTGALGKPVRYQQVPAEAVKAAMTGSGMSEAMAQGMVDMLLAKNEGLDNLEPRTRESASPTTFRSWCEEVFKPALLARGSAPI